MTASYAMIIALLAGFIGLLATLRPYYSNAAKPIDWLALSCCLIAAIASFVALRTA